MMTRIGTKCIYFVRPVVYRFFVVDLLSEPADEGARRPHLAALFLLSEHSIQDRRQPVFEFAVIVVWNDEIAYAVHASPPQVCAIQVEVRKIRLSEAFDEVFLDPAGCGHDRADMFVLYEVQDDLAKSGRDEVRRIAKEDVAFGVFSYFL